MLLHFVDVQPDATMLSNQIAASRIYHVDTRLVCIQSSVGIVEEEVVHVRIELFTDEIFSLLS